MTRLSDHEISTITKYDLLFEGRLSRTEGLSEELSRDMKEIRADFRWLVGIMLGGFGTMFALMAHGFHWY